LVITDSKKAVFKKCTTNCDSKTGAVLKESLKHVLANHFDQSKHTGIQINPK